MNRNLFTNRHVSEEMKQRIVNDVLVKEQPSQVVAMKYGLKIQRIEAIVKLAEVEQRWEEENKITKDLRKMSDVIYKMFPVYENSGLQAENLTEIPIPEKTQQSRFLTIAESQPFGPVDAAKEFGLEPAAVTLQKLSETGAHSAHTAGDMLSDLLMPRLVKLVTDTVKCSEITEKIERLVSMLLVT
ncbi:unnamed protein product [Ambrosiozyma monospora]|uniref:Unnamed protein product n=1 Tax=Ambrosiozyma monospora TaxID=43982 RepID=A0ACB5UA85_AMBMO|nr:unnamed protein product [Ambrosiozyma monospora]